MKKTTTKKTAAPNMPLVSCLCLTMASRLEFLKQAIACFLAQDYPNRELVIVADFGADVWGAVPDDDRIKRLECSGSIGEKRNFGVANSSGEIIAHWDDDDFSAPGRLTDQVTRLLESGKAVTGYRNLIFSDGTRRWLNTNDVHWAFDASLCYRREFWQGHHFEAINDGLEASFRARAVREFQLVTAPGEEFLIASIHPGNTSPRTIGEGWTLLDA